MGAGDGDEFDWAVRTGVFRHIVERGRPPSAAETAETMGVGVEVALAAMQRLHHRHALLLDADGASIRMANPFSGVATSFRVRAREQAYWANCAWDALGIPAALKTDARIESSCAEDGSPIVLRVSDGRGVGRGEVVHFLVPFRRWYDDLVYT